MRTDIYRLTEQGEHAVGYLEAGIIYKLRWNEGRPVGSATEAGRILQKTQYDERDLGHVDEDGVVHSNGLFEGGTLGWIEESGTVVQAGFTFSEEDVGRVEGSEPFAAGAALLLLFLPAEREEDRRAMRK